MRLPGRRTGTRHGQVESVPTPGIMYLNLASYLFTDLDDLPTLRQDIHQAGATLRIRGTVLLAAEGINIFVCGVEADARAFAAYLAGLPALHRLSFKESWSEKHSFNRLLVKLKKEIITFHQPGCRPAVGRAPAVDAASLARWLDRGSDDEGRPVVMVDTRNAFETQVGAFVGAVDPELKSFTDLPRALATHHEDLAGKRVVTYCTGGIRCEKAALYLSANGFQHVVQLEGGVLKYFEEVGGRHWQGELFVFDKRVSLKPDLTPGTWEQDYSSRRIRPAGPAPAADPASRT
jgi:UPF0176 protein